MGRKMTGKKFDGGYVFKCTEKELDIILCCMRHRNCHAIRDTLKQGDFSYATDDEICTITATKHGAIAMHKSLFLVGLLFREQLRETFMAYGDEDMRPRYTARIAKLSRLLSDVEAIAFKVFDK